MANEAARFNFLLRHLHNFTTGKGQWVKFYYCSIDLIEHNKGFDWLYVQHYVTPFGPRQRRCLIYHPHLPKEDVKMREGTQNFRCEK